MRLDPFASASSEFIWASCIAIIAWAVPMNWVLHVGVLILALAFAAESIRRTGWGTTAKACAVLVSILFLCLLVFPTIRKEYEGKTDLQPEIMDQVNHIAEQENSRDQGPPLNHYLGRLTQSFPGFWTQMYLRIDSLYAQRRNFFFDFAEPSGASVSLFISPIGNLTFRVIDVHDEPYAVVVPTGADGIPLGQGVKILCEVGVASNYSFLRVYMNTKIVREEVFESPLDLGTRRWGGTEGADRTGHNGTAFSEVYFISGVMTPNDDDVVKLMTSAP